MSGLIYAPGERYVVAHGSADDETVCGLPVTDGWQALPPYLTTPECAECTARVRLLRAQARTGPKATPSLGDQSSTGAAAGEAPPPADPVQAPRPPAMRSAPAGADPVPEEMTAATPGGAISRLLRRLRKALT
ncbi:hypothetical protein HD597_011281 [Nonomuraea thailandensis]|uniref:Uncharacterized protein n=1 Tax=Nonomuraea thailandensis TaxID=1188745 RepID=A0A9X2GYT8_9ACTN|nr:hypothetical protein [Nonomuraea thailandensis]MCP2364261.1 hypothetical protein [Nonomuraea thailandensis]